jgi:hypothetical protein
VDAESLMVGGREPAQITREEWDWARERINAHDAALKTHGRTMSNVQLALDELSKWKEDSKVQEIAALKGQIKRYSRVRDRLLYILATGAILEGVRLLVDHFLHK